MMRAVSGVADWYRANLRDTSPDFRARGDAGKAVAAAGASVATFVAAAPDVVNCVEGMNSACLPMDKIVHAQATFIMTVTASCVIGLPPWLAASSSFVLGTVGKEIILDSMLGKGTPDPKDALANLSGALAGYAFAKVARPRRNP